MQQPYYWNGIPPAATPDQLWSEWAGRLYQSEQQLKQVTEQLTQLQNQLNEIKNKPPLHVEYHFDQLKVNRLEGTLNVGLTPQGIQGIESFEAPDPACWKVSSNEPEGTPEPAIHSLQKEMNDYMDENSARLLLSMERQYGVSLEEDHRNKVLEDVKRQINERVHYYAQAAAYPAKATDEEMQQWRNSIKEKTAQDIQSAFGAYLTKLKQQPPQRSPESS